MEDKKRSLSVNDTIDFIDESRITEPPSFGILDLPSTIIYAAPIFSEFATIEAMKRLSYNSEDLVIDKITDYSGDPSIRILVSLDLEKERLLKIEKIIKTRDKILNGKVNDTINLNEKNKLDDLRLKHRKKTKKEKNILKPPSVRSYNVPFCPKENTSFPPRQIIDKIDQGRRQKSERLQKGAQERYLRQQHTLAMMEARRRESAAQSALELKKQADQMNKIQAKKKKQYEAEMKWRQQNIYKPLSLPKRGKSTDDDIIEMRRNLIKNRRWNSTKIVSISRPLDNTQKGNSRIPILRKSK